MKKVSIIITSYNQAKFLEPAINSVLNQTFQEIEIVIVDDCSTELKTIHLLNTLKNHKKVSVILKDKNTGVVDTRNIGIKNAQSQLIVCLDGDDLLDKKYIEEVYKASLNNPKKDCFTPKPKF